MLGLKVHRKIESYLKFCKSTALWADAGTGNVNEVNYLWAGLIAEVGEIAELVQKNIRDGKAITKDEVMYELGDVLFYTFLLADLESAFIRDSVLYGSRTSPLITSPIGTLVRLMVTPSVYNVYHAILAVGEHFGLTFDQILDGNVRKLKRRIKNGTIRGSGSHR